MSGPDRYLAELVERVRGELAGELLAAYSIGSAALGDWVAGASDLDVLVVCAERLAPQRARRLADRLWHRALPCPARGLELVVYRRDAIAAPGARVAFELNLNTGPRMEDHLSVDPGEEPAHWFLLDVAQAREHAAVLCGPPPRRLIGPVARAHVLAALAESLRWHGEAEPASANTVLNACRAWRQVAVGDWVSKTRAGGWALPRSEVPGVIEAALERRAGRDAPIDPADARRHLRAVERILREALSRGA